MTFSPGFKIAYWIGLIGVLSWFLSLRIADAIAGHATAPDAFVFAIWIALLLSPLFPELEFWGIKLKREVDKAKAEIVHEIATLKTEISSAVDVRTNVNPQFYFPTPPADAQLPAIEKQIEKAVEEAFLARGVSKADALRAANPVDDDIEFLILTRYQLEKELRRLARDRQLIAEGGRPAAGYQLTHALVQGGVISPTLGSAVREVYSVCSPAVHGEDVSSAQVAFVREVGPQLIATLQTTPGRMLPDDALHLSSDLM